MISSDVRILWQLLRGNPFVADHGARLERFYAPQAHAYDDFRDRLLHGRAELLERLCLDEGHSVVELGCGTGRNLTFLSPAHRAALGRIDLVDLCPSLLAVARERTADWANVRVIEADAGSYRPDIPVDRVFLSYALTMMPDWRRVLRNACRMLRPGGLIGVVDFTTLPAAGLSRRARWREALMQRWFRRDGVILDAAHGAFLDGMFERIARYDGISPIPYVPGMKARYYLFIGRK